jgi:hypothetical protein
MDGVELPSGLVRPGAKPRVQNAKMGVQRAPGARAPGAKAPGARAPGARAPG